MSKEFDDATQAQIDAANPANSTWVTANAGSGKTRVLTDRVARLLLQGTLPQRILCLTYTKAAAAEMQTRLFERLGSWSMMENNELQAALEELGEAKDNLSSERLQSARTLFAMALETPGGLKIQTIHSFCDALLRQFPLEASVSPQFAVLTDHQARTLQTDVLEQLATINPDEFRDLALHFTGADLDGLAAEIIRNRAKFSNAPSLADFNLSPDATLQSCAATALTPDAMATLQTLHEVLDQKAEKVTDTKLKESLDEFFRSNDVLEQIKILETAFLTDGSSDSPPRISSRSGPTKDICTNNNALKDDVNVVKLSVETFNKQRRSLLGFHRSTVLHSFATAFLSAYQDRKSRSGFLDYDDLIAKASNLLSTSAMAQWVLFRLDGGIDHILVDEAQDTSPIQWRVIQQLHREFTVGDSANRADRTLFVVGDEKQSIYSFQGADPDAFDQMKDHFSETLAQSDQKLFKSDLKFSFRSASPILAVADAVLDTAARDQFHGNIEHMPFFNAKPGRVDLWPFIEQPQKGEDVEWFKPVNQPAPSDPAFELANRISQYIRYLLDTAHPIPANSVGNETRPVRPSDFLILVQRRSKVFDPIIRALKTMDIPIAGADVLMISEELAVRDILSLLKFAATPDDDLSLAEVLRSPICGLSEQDLFRLAHGRAGFLWQELRRRAAEYPVAYALLSDVLQKAEFLRPFELIDRILTHHGARRRILARLGYEAEDAIDELLSLSLEFEQEQAPTLSGFVSWFDTTQAKIKRELDRNTDQVRVMTVHGSKGLEAPIVILPETQQIQRRDTNSLLTLESGLVTWPAASSKLADTQWAAKQRSKEMADRENKRLLYVALTRAESWLILAGAGKQSKKGDDWYSIVQSAMDHAGATKGDVDGIGETFSLTNEEWHLMAKSSPVVDTPASVIQTPEWLGQHAAALPRPVQTIAPSSLPGAKALASELAELSAEHAMLRGSILHSMLEHLPLVEVSQRAKVARHLFDSFASVVVDFEDVLAEAAMILDAPHLADLFAPSTLSEVEIAAPVAELNGRVVNGAIDRLVITPQTVRIVDFKTNAAIPKQPQDVPAGILAQLGAYSRAVEQIYPERTVETEILWTRDATLMSIPHDIVINALQSTQHLDPVPAAT